MAGRATTADDGRTLTVRVPVTFRKRGGRKQVVSPEGASAWVSPRARIDNTMIKAIARAHRWKQLLESGRFTSVTELAGAEKINQSYLCRVLRLTLLAPDIVEAILDGRQPAGMQLEDLLKPFPLEWERQIAVRKGPILHQIDLDAARLLAVKANNEGVSATSFQGAECPVFDSQGRVVFRE